MVRVYLFWVLLSLPGFALMNRVPRARAHVGDLGSISVAYLFSFLFLAPFSIAGYWFQLPLGLLSSAIVLVVLLAGIDLYFARHRWISRLPRPDLVFLTGAFVLLLFFVYDALIGPSMDRDANFHLARIRFLYENGLSNADPYIGKEYHQVYHTNLFHAVIASGSRLSGIDILSFWYWSSVWGKLVSASSIYFLTYTVFRDRFSAWLSTFWFLGVTILVVRTIYPNQLAPYWLVPTALAFTVHAFSKKRALFYSCSIGVSSFLIGQVHSLYAVFLAVSVSAAAVAFLSWVAVLRNRAELFRSVLFACGVIIAVGGAAPFIAVNKFGLFTKMTAAQGSERKPPDATDRKPASIAKEIASILTPASKRIKPDRWSMAFDYTEKEGLAFRDETLFGGRLYQIILLCTVLFIGVMSRDKKRFYIFVNIVAVQVALFLISPLATYAVSVLGEVWILERMLDITSLSFPVIAIGGLFSLFNRLPPRTILPLPLFCRLPPVAIPILAMSFAFLGIYCSSIANPRSNLQAAYYVFRQNVTQLTNYNNLRELKRQRRFLRKTVPQNSVLLANPGVGRGIAKLHSLRFVTVYRDLWVSDAAQRERDIRLLLRKNVKPWIIVTLIDKYGVQYILRTKSEFPWAEKYATLKGKYGYMQIFRINGPSKTQPKPTVH